MIFRTHLAFGLLIALISLKFLNIKNLILFIFIVGFSSIIVDIDYRKSKIGKKTKILSYFFNFVFRHRGFFHTIYIPFIIYLLSITVNYDTIGLAFLLGYLSHLLLDALTISGIKPFSPLFKVKIDGFIRTGSFFENLFFVLILILDIYLVYPFLLLII
jgi:inner membrane protein